MNLVMPTGDRGRTRHRSHRAGAEGHQPAVDDSPLPMPAAADGADVLNQLYDRYWTDLVKYVNSMLSDLHQAEEIAQETMLRAWRHADKLVPERGSVWGWLSRVAHNIMVDRIRYRRVRPAEVDEAAAGPDAQVTADHSPDVANSVYLVQAITQLHAAHRAVLYLVYYQDRTCAEAAAVLGVPVGTVKSRLHYALRYLRDALQHDRADYG